MRILKAIVSLNECQHSVFRFALRFLIRVPCHFNGMFIFNPTAENKLSAGIIREWQATYYLMACNNVPILSQKPLNQH